MILVHFSIELWSTEASSLSLLLKYPFIVFKKLFRTFERILMVLKSLDFKEFLNE